MFTDSKSTRLVQLADSIVYWIYRRYSALDDWGWRVIQPHLANLGNGRTGLHEVLAPATPAALQGLVPSTWPFPLPLPPQPAPAAATAAPAAGPARIALAAGAVVRP